MAAALVFLVGLFLIGTTSAQCPTPCSDCKVFPGGKYEGTWNRKAEFDTRCNDSCLYQRDSDGEEQCFCDPGPTKYDPCNGDQCTIKDCTDSSQCGKSCAGCFGRKCLSFKPDIENCCNRKQKGNTFHHLVAYNKTDNCTSGCMYTADVTKQENYCLDEETAVCNLTAVGGNTSMHEHLTRSQQPSITDPPGFVCLSGKHNGRYDCHTSWYVIQDIDDFKHFKLLCDHGPTSTDFMTLNGLQLICHFDINNDQYHCRYHYWCSPVSHNIIHIDETTETAFSPNSKSVQYFTEQLVYCNANTNFLFGLTMKTDLTSAQMHYKLICGAVVGTPVCQNFTSPILPAPGYNFIYLPNQQFQCPTTTTNNKPNLRQFQLHNGTDTLYYDYECCTF